MKIFRTHRATAVAVFAFSSLGHEVVAEDTSFFPPEWALSWDRATVVEVSSWQDPHAGGKPGDLELVSEECLKGSALDIRRKNTAKLHQQGEMELTFMWTSSDPADFFKSVSFDVPLKDRKQVVAFEKWIKEVKDGTVKVLPVH